MLWSIAASEQIEAAVHARLRARWAHHEWFDLGADPLPTVRRVMHELIERYGSDLRDLNTRQWRGIRDRVLNDYQEDS
jgi:hypothetical protein